MSTGKKKILVFIFSLLSLGAFAAPGGGNRGGGGGNRGGNSPSGASRGSGGATNPSFSNSSRPSPSSPQNSNSRPAPAPKPSDAGGNPPPAPNNGNAGNFGKNEALPGEVINYRGTRIISENDAFTLQAVKTERVNAKEVSLELTFNQSVNPHTFTSDSILVDGEEISSKTKFAFNKKGDTIKITVPVQNENFTLTIKDVKSFDGTKIEPIEIKNISDNSGT